MKELFFKPTREIYALGYAMKPFVFKNLNKLTKKIFFESEHRQAGVGGGAQGAGQRES